MMASRHRSLSCPRCSGQMEAGFTVDEGHGTRSVPKWVEGEPVKSIWTGLRLRGREKFEVVTYRCRRCGYLESYA